MPFLNNIIIAPAATGRAIIIAYVRLTRKSGEISQDQIMRKPIEKKEFTNTVNRLLLN